jgi:hypothetical protein
VGESELGEGGAAGQGACEVEGGGGVEVVAGETERVEGAGAGQAGRVLAGPRAVEEGVVDGEAGEACAPA